MIIKTEFISQKTAFEPFNTMSKTPNCVFIYDIVDDLAVMRGKKETQINISEKYKKKKSICIAYVKLFYVWSFCSVPSNLKLTLPFLRQGQNKRDITSEVGKAKSFIVALNK